MVQISLLNGKGVEELKSAVHQELLEGDAVWGDSPIVTNVRHHDALRRGRLALGHAIESVAQHMPPDLVAVDLHSSLDCLGEIVGKTTTEDILGRIFSQFCVGK